MASQRQERRNELARELGYRNDYDRRHWERPQGTYFEQRAQAAADKNGLTYEEVYHDKNSEYWQLFRQAQREGVTIGRDGKWAEPASGHVRYGSAYGTWLLYDDYISEEDWHDDFDTGEPNE